jgi:hypothetical protein
MPFYSNSDSLYNALKATFARIEKEAPNHLDGLHSLMSSRTILRLKTTAPATEVTLNGREKQFKATYGPSTLRADLTVELAADTLHQILLDELSIKKAWGNGKIKVLGPVWKLKVLTDLVKGARDYYPAVLRDQKLA